MPKIADIEDTPNPNAVKFVLKEPLTWGVTRSYENAEQAQDDPLAAALFAIEHVTNVFYVDRWLTVTQDGEADWPELTRLIAIPIRAAPAAEARSAGTVAAAATAIAGLSLPLLLSLPEWLLPAQLPSASSCPMDAHCWTGSACG